MAQVNATTAVPGAVYLPLCLNITGKRIVVIGGGAAAVHKVRGLVRYTHEITVVAPRVARAISALGVTVVRARYHPRLLAGAGLVYACTDIRETNRRICTAARKRGIIANSADDPAASDFVSPAIFKQGVMSIAVSSNATNVKRAIAWRDEIRKLFTAQVIHS